MKRRHVLRTLGYVVLGAVLVVVNVVAGALLYLSSDRGRERVLAYAMRKLAPVFPGGISLDGSEGDLTRRLVLKGLVIRDLDGRPAVRVDRIELRYALARLLHAHLHLSQVSVSGATVTSRPLADGRDNLSTMAVLDEPLPPLPRVSPISIWLEALDVDARLEQPRTRDVRAQLHARGEVSRGMVATLDELGVTLTSPTHATLTAHGAVDLGGAVALRKVEVRVDGDLTALRRRVGKQALAGEAVVVATADGALDDLEATLALDTDTPRVRLRGAAHVLSDRVALRSLSATAPFASVSAEGVYRFDRTGQGEVHVDASDLSPLALFGAPDMAGAVKLDVKGSRDAAQLSARASGTVRAFRIGSERIEHASLDARVDDLRGHAHVALSGVEVGGVQLRSATVSADGGADAMRVEARARGPEGVELETVLSGSSKLVHDRLSALEVTIERLRLRAGGAAWVSDGPARVTAELERGVYVLRPLGLSSEKQHVTLEGKLQDRALADVHVDLQHFDLSQLPGVLAPGHLLPHTDVQAQLEAAGPIERPDVGFRFEGRGDGRSRRDLIHIKAKGEGRLARGRLNAKVFATIAGQKASAKVDMPLPLRPDEPIDVSVDASVLLSPWFADQLVPKLIQTQPIIMYALGAKVTAQASLTGTTSDPRINGSARVARWSAAGEHGDLGASFEYGQKRLRASGNLTFTHLPFGIGKDGSIHASATMPLDLGIPLSGGSGRILDGAAPWDARLDVHRIDIERLPWQAFAIVPPVRHGRFDGVFELAGTPDDPKATVRIDATSLEVAGVTDVGVRGTANLDGKKARANLRMSIRGSDALHFAGSLADASAAGWRTAPISATLVAPGFDLTKLQLVSEVEGTFEGNAQLEGTWTHPRLVAKVRVPDLRAGQTRYQRFDVEGVARADQLTLSLDARDESGASLTGRVVVPVAGGALRGELVADRFRMELRSELLPELRVLRGQVDGRVAIGGTTEHPRLDGVLALARAELGLAGTAITYRDGAARFRLAGDQIYVEQAHLDTGSGGSADGEGKLSIRDLRIDILAGELALRKFPMRWDTTTAVVDAKLSLHGRRSGARLRTDVAIVEGHVQLSEDADPEGLIAVRHLEDVEVKKARPKPLAIPLGDDPSSGANGQGGSFTLTGPFRVEGRATDVLARADLRVDLSADRPAASGVIMLDPKGTVRVRGEAREVVSGRLLFDDAVQPKVELETVARPALSR